MSTISFEQDSKKSLEVRKRNNKANAISENVRLAKIRAEAADAADDEGDGEPAGGGRLVGELAAAGYAPAG